MAKVRDSGPWLVLAILSVLLVVLGYLQYRWTHELGRAAAERLQTDLERTARRFAAALERELGQTAIAFFTDAGPTPSETRALLADRLEEWHTRENGGLVSGLLLATRTDKGRVVLEETQPGDDAFHELAWPESLRPLAARLAEGDAPGPGSFPIRPGSVIEKPLAIVLPVFGAPLGRGRAPCGHA